MRLKRFVFSCLIAVGVACIGSTGAAAPLMIEKNLFAQDRKPPPPESAVSTAQPNRPGMPITNIQLDGVVIQGTAKKAIVRLKNPGAGGDKKKVQSPFVTVREGQQVGDFRVTKIEPKSISLEKDGQTHVVSLFAENKVSTPAALPAPAGNVATLPAEAPPPPGVAPSDQPPGVPQQAMSRRQMQMQQNQGMQPPPMPPSPPGFPDPAFQPQGIPDNLAEMPPPMPPDTGAGAQESPPPIEGEEQ